MPVLLAFVAGVLLLQMQASLPAPFFTGVLLLPALLALYFWRSYGWRRQAVFMLLAFGIGFFWASWRAEWRLAEELPADLTWRDITVEGVVLGFPKVNDEHSRFDFYVERITSPRTVSLRMKARLSDYHRNKAPLSVLADGARLSFVVRLRKPTTSVNPHGFDYAAHLFAGDIPLSGYVRERDSIEVLDAGGSLRESLRQQIFTAVPQDVGALLAALVVGDRSKIDDDKWRILRRTGTAHLVSVSGMHVSLAAGFVALLTAFLWRRRVPLMRFMPTQKAALIAAIPAAFAYALLAGFAVPVRRSFFMLLAAALIVLQGGFASPTVVLSLVAALIVAIDPWAVLSAGFWLSFLLSGALIVSAMAASSVRDFVFRLLRLQALLSLFAMPLTLWFFGEASLISPIANLIAVPVVGFLALPLALADIFIPGDYLWRLSGFILEYLWLFLSELAQLPYASWQPAAAPMWLFLMALSGVFWLLMPAGTPLRLAGLFPLLAMLLWSPPPPKAGTLEMTVLDVGQGSAVVLRTTSHVMVADVGSDYGGNIVQSYLRAVGVRRVDALLLSHDDKDHAGGTEHLLAENKVSEIISSLTPTRVREFPEHRQRRCLAQDRWEWDGVLFEILHPQIEQYGGGYADNDKSCVLKIQSDDFSVLLMGDVSADIENILRRQEAIRADVLVASHHGSRYSSTKKFLAAVQPTAVIFSAGKHNPYGHPHPDALTRAQNIGATIYRTDKDGAIIIRQDDGLNINKWRDKYRRYWHD